MAVLFLKNKFFKNFIYLADYYCVILKKTMDYTG